MVQRVATWEELEGAHLWNDDELKLKLIFVCLFQSKDRIITVLSSKIIIFICVCFGEIWL